MNNTQNLTVTTMDELIRMSSGTIIELPPFVEGQPFIAQLKRPSMLALVRAGKIPNALLQSANSLFINGTISAKNDNAMKDLFDVLDAICEACFVNPTYKQLKDAGVELTDEQLMFVFQYTQKGVEALKGFRSQLRDSESNTDGDTV